MQAAEFRAKDGGSRHVIAQRHFDTIKRLCEQAQGVRTGGPILGKRNAAVDRATVTAISDEPLDGMQRASWFYPGVQQMRALIKRHWPLPTTWYLGEWHFHPNRSSAPHQGDMERMMTLATVPGYLCPEPLFIIVGGYPAQPLELGVYVFRRAQDRIETLSAG